MLLHQLLAIIIYSGWHYGRVFHENQKNSIDLQQAFARVLLILLMSYFLYAKTLLFCAIIFSKLIYDIITAIITPHPMSKTRQNVFDAIVGLSCCIVYIIG